MKSDAYGEYTICNIYYDTDNFRLIRVSLEKPIYKESCACAATACRRRTRKVFVELKKKFDGVAHKRRITTGIQNVGRFSPASWRVKTSARSDARWLFPVVLSNRAQGLHRLRPARLLRASTIRSFASFGTNLRWRDTDRQPSPRRPRRADPRCPARRADGGQDPRHVPAVAHITRRLKRSPGRFLKYECLLRNELSAGVRTQPT